MPKKHSPTRKERAAELKRQESIPCVWKEQPSPESVRLFQQKVLDDLFKMQQKNTKDNPVESL